MLGRLGVFGALLVGVTGCGASDDPAEPLGVTSQAVNAPLPSAYCNINVTGKGMTPTETVYIPHAIQCENGGANLEALKAQAIAARSVAYHTMATAGEICDSQDCQVYTCGKTPEPIHYQAAQETAGMYLSHSGLLTYGFYVDGDHTPNGTTCKGSPSGNNENYVTYNEGKTGAAVDMTSLGWIPPNQAVYGTNRGCMAQWGARCLENNRGYKVNDILKFYYGDDIQVLQGTGPCVGPTNRPPDGHFDSVTCETVSGWAWDPDDPDLSVSVSIYVDSMTGSPAATVAADVYRADLCSAIGSCEHGFEYSLQGLLDDGFSHTVYVQASDTGGGSDVELQNSPRIITCASGGTGGVGGGSGQGAAGPGGAGGATAGNGGTAGTSTLTGQGGGPGQGGTAAGATGNPGQPGQPGQDTRVLSDADEGCGCRVPSSPRRGLAWPVLAGLAGIAAFSRRKRPS